MAQIWNRYANTDANTDADANANGIRTHTKNNKKQYDPSFHLRWGGRKRGGSGGSILNQGVAKALW